MPIIRSQRLIFAATTLFLVFGWTLLAVYAQQRTTAPDISVNGVKLGDRTSSKVFLNGYQYRTDGGIPTYYFYNSRVTTVLKLTGASFEDPYFITGIEVYNVGPEYKFKHFVLEKVGHFLTESGIHVGYRQSGADIAFSVTVGIPGVVGDSITGPKYVLKKIGEPTTHSKNGDEETFDYRIENFGLPYADDAGRTVKYRYLAHYRFYQKKLNRFSIRIEADTPAPKP
jgi:hypothetical protein